MQVGSRSAQKSECSRQTRITRARFIKFKPAAALYSIFPELGGRRGTFRVAFTPACKSAAAISCGSKPLSECQHQPKQTAARARPTPSLHRAPADQRCEQPTRSLANRAPEKQKIVPTPAVHKSPLFPSDGLAKQAAQKPRAKAETHGGWWRRGQRREGEREERMGVRDARRLVGRTVGQTEKGEEERKREREGGKKYKMKMRVGREISSSGHWTELIECKYRRDVLWSSPLHCPAGG